MEFIDSAISMVGMLAILFLIATCIGAGLHLGMWICAAVFGPIKATAVHHRDSEGDA